MKRRVLLCTRCGKEVFGTTTINNRVVCPECLHRAVVRWFGESKVEYERERA